MSTNVREQLRQLAEAFDEFVDDVSVEELIGRPGVTGGAEDSAWIEPNADDSAGAPTWRRFGVAAAALLLLLGMAGALATVDRGSPESAGGLASPAGTGASASAVTFGQFVWPAPAAGYASLGELVGAFTTEVMGWTAFDLVGDVDDQLRPQSLTLSNTLLDAEVTVIAVPSPEGWGFVQIGPSVSASMGDDGHVTLEFPTDAAVTSTFVTVRLAGGAIFEVTVDTGWVELPDTQLDQVVSALVVGYDAVGDAIMAAGGQFNSDATPTIHDATAPNSIPADLAEEEPYGPLDYAATDSMLPLWPYTNASDPVAATTGYGMHLCDSGYGTKVLRVDPATGSSHAYSGTLCVFIKLDEARPDSITTCATTTGGFNYARCQRATDDTVTTGAGTSVIAVASEQHQASMAAFPTATEWDQSEEFDVVVAAAAGAPSSVDFEDNTVAVTLAAADSKDGVDLPGVCFRIDLPGAVADGCVGRGLLATGLAYGAFQDGDGPIEIIGIVPDDVTEVRINETALTPTNNVWHYTATQGAPLHITARSPDGRVATTG